MKKVIISDVKEKSIPKFPKHYYQQYYRHQYKILANFFYFYGADIADKILKHL